MFSRAIQTHRNRSRRVGSIHSSLDDIQRLARNSPWKRTSTRRTNQTMSSASIHNDWREFVAYKATKSTTPYHMSYNHMRAKII